MDAERLLRFESFELDTRSRELRKGKNRIRLQEQPFEILRLMLERPGDVVTREELARKLWPEGTFVDFEHSLNAAVKRLRAALGDDADNPRFVETLPRRGYRFIASLGGGPSTSLGAGTAIAMPSLAPDYKARLAGMPFANLSGDSSQEYFSDGLTEEMFLQLGRLGRGRIGVISRSSSNLFRGSTRRAREIGEMLRADYLLEGSVRREADRVRITAQLVETSSESHLWTDVYERNLTDCLTVQAEVAARIAQSLAVELLPEQPVQPSTDAAAYQTYLKGRYYWNLPGDQGFPQAIVYFRQASEADPSFAAAHADLARTYTGQAEYYNMVPREALETARPIAERSLQLDPHLSHAHLAVANIRAMLDWDWDAAEAGFRQAIALNPSSDGAYRWYGLLLAGLGKSSEAVREAQLARELDPLCLVVGTSAAWTQYAAGDYEAAIDTCSRPRGACSGRRSSRWDARRKAWRSSRQPPRTRPRTPCCSRGSRTRRPPAASAASRVPSSTRSIGCARSGSSPRTTLRSRTSASGSTTRCFDCSTRRARSATSRSSTWPPTRGSIQFAATHGSPR